MNSETDPDTSQEDQETGGKDPECGSEFNEGDMEVGDGGIGEVTEVESLGIQSGGSNIDSPYANPSAAGGVPFTIHQDKYGPPGTLTWTMENRDMSAVIQLSLAPTLGLWIYTLQKLRLLN
jgi:hypothetical protein